MDLKNNAITMSEIMENQTAKQFLISELSGYVNPQMIAFAANMTLNNVIGFAKTKMSQDKIDNILNTLENI